MEFLFLYLVAAEAVVFCISILLVNLCSKELASYLSSSHPEFLEKSLSAPYWAGDWSVMSRHIRAIRNAYFGEMPDESSRRLQKKMRFYGVLALFLFLLGIGTFVTSVVILVD
jgi:hypothetical protein